jgi:hypothetical protein
MKEIISQIEIGAPAQCVWEVLLDFDSYPEWNPFITAISARTGVRTELKLRTRVPGRPALSSRANLLTFEPGRQLSWQGHRLVPGLLEREHALELEPSPAARVRVRHSLRIKGLLGPLFPLKTEPTRQALDQMNEALKNRAEAVREQGPASRAA